MGISSLSDKIRFPGFAQRGLERPLFEFAKKRNVISLHCGKCIGLIAAIPFSKQEKNVWWKYPYNGGAQPYIQAKLKQNLREHSVPLRKLAPKQSEGHKRSLGQIGKYSQYDIQRNQNRGGEEDLFPRHFAEKEKTTNADGREKKNG